MRSILVLAGAAKRVISPYSERPKCPYRKKPIRCPGRLAELLDENGKSRQHHSGYMPEPGRSRINGRDTDRDPIIQIEAMCQFCLAQFWGRSLKSISEMRLLPQDITTWLNTREIKVMRKFCPRVFPPDQIARAEEQARR